MERTAEASELRQRANQTNCGSLLLDDPVDSALTSQALLTIAQRKLVLGNLSGPRL